jgi:tRNA(fMet)-specific endonuclease VapC
MMYLLDTNICIYVINHKPQQVFERFRQYQLGELAVSSITASELAFGVEKSGSERNKQALKKFLSPLEILPYDEQAVWHYAQLRHDRESGHADCSTCIGFRCTTGHQ